MKCKECSKTTDNKKKFNIKRQLCVKCYCRARDQGEISTRPKGKGKLKLDIKSIPEEYDERFITYEYRYKIKMLELKHLSFPEANLIAMRSALDEV